MTLSSLTQHDISYKGEEDPDDKRQILPSPQEVTSCYFPQLNRDDSCEKISLSHKSDIHRKTQDIPIVAMPIMK